jgi:hypothetical protein
MLRKFNYFACKVNYFLRFIEQKIKGFSKIFSQNLI